MIHSRPWLTLSFIMTALLPATARAQISWDEKSEMRMDGIMPGNRASEAKVAISGARRSTEKTLLGSPVIEITDYEKGVVDTLYPQEKTYTERKLFPDVGDVKKANATPQEHPETTAAKETSGEFFMSAKFTGKTSTLGSMKCREILRTMKTTGGDESKGTLNMELTTSRCLPAPAEYLKLKASEAEATNRYFEKLKGAGMAMPALAQAQLQNNSSGLDQFAQMAKAQKLPIHIDVPADVQEALTKGFESSSIASLSTAQKMTVVTTRSNLSTQTGSAVFDVPADYKKTEKHAFGGGALDMEKLKKMGVDTEKLKQMMAAHPPASP